MNTSMQVRMAGAALSAIAVMGAASMGGCDSKGDATSSARASEPAPPTAPRRLNPGWWETVTTVNGRAMPPATVCISQATADEINGDDAAVRRGLTQTNAAPGCDVKNIVIEGAKVAFDTVCDGQTIHSSITYGGDHYAGEMTGAGMAAMGLSARRIGECPAGQGG